jgi:16S rRNA processing protein RimM
LKKVELVAVGRVIRSEGKNGSLKIKLHKWIRKEPFFKKIYLEKEGECKEYEVEQFSLVRNCPFLKLKGVESLKEAEGLRGREILVGPEEFPDPGSGSYYDFQLLGCLVKTVDGKLVGEVKGLISIGSCPLLVTEKGGKQVEIPLVEAICRKIDREKKEIIIDPPEGLLDLNEI